MSQGGKGCLSIVAIIAAIVLVFGWLILDGSTTGARTIHYRLTLVVDTPEGERSGSSVVQMVIRFPGGLTKAQGWGITTAVLGEATTVDLGARGLLVAVLVSERSLSAGRTGPYGLQFRESDYRGQYRDHDGSSAEFASYLDELNRVKPKTEIASDHLPMLVRFRDPKDQTTVERVDPADLAASFGPGVKLKSVTMEITDDPVTKTIESRLPWLAKDKDAPRLLKKPDGMSAALKDTPLIYLLSYDMFRRSYQ